MHSDFYENRSDEIISLREEVSRLRRAVDLDEVNTLKKLVLLSLDECDELTGKVEQLEAALPKWISVEERLPENLADVLICDSDNRLVVCHYNEYDERFWKRVSDNTFHSVNAVYWMPLPEKPKEDT